MGHIKQCYSLSICHDPVCSIDSRSLLRGEVEIRGCSIHVSCLNYAASYQ